MKLIGNVLRAIYWFIFMFVLCRLSRSECDKTTLQETVTRLKDKLDQLERDLGQSQEKERQVVMKNASLTNKLKAEKEEVGFLGPISI